VNSIITDARRKRTNLQPAELKGLRFIVNAMLKQATLTAYADGRYVVNVPAAAAPAAPKPTEAAEAAPAVDANLAARYGRRPAPAPTTTRRAAALPQQDPMAMAQKLFTDSSKGGKGLNDLSTEGTWVRSSDKYILSSKKDGKDDVREASISEVGRLTIPVPELKMTLFFVRAI
jgi:hypothetical protein